MSESSNWVRCTLGDVTQVSTGKLDANAAVEGGAYPFFTCGDETLSIDIFAFDCPAVLLAGNGNFGIKMYKGKFNAYQRTYVIEPREIDCDFLYHLVRYSIAGITIGNRGSTIRYLRLGDIIDCPVSIPPLAEQKRIVAKIEELTARSRRAKEALDAVPPLLDKLRQSILAAAFRGDLTADWRAKNPNVEPADKLIARIRAERRACWEAAELAKLTAKGKHPTDDRWKAKYPAPPESDLIEMPDLPDGWSWLSLSELSWDSGYGTSVKCSYEGTGEAVLRIPNIAKGVVELSDVKRATSELGVGTDKLLAPGDFLVVRTNGSKDLIGRAACVEGKGAGSFFASYLIRFRLLGREILWWWVSACWRSQWIRGRIESTAATSAGQYNISLTELAQFPIPVPPHEEQAALMEMLSIALERLENLEANVAGLQRQLRDLETSILSTAFQGELVPQDPSDEPAAILLERIRAARTSAEPSGTRSRRRTQKAEAVTDADAGGNMNDGEGGNMNDDEAGLDDPDETDMDDADDAPPSVRAPSTRSATKNLSQFDRDNRNIEVFMALWPHGPLEKDVAVRMVAEHLRAAGHIDFQRLRGDGPLYADILSAIEVAVKDGALDRPRRGYVRACKPDATTFTADDWRHALVASLGVDAIDRDDAIRLAAEWARDNLGLKFSRLRSDGHIVEGLRSAINSAIRRGEVRRLDARRIERRDRDEVAPVDSPLDSEEDEGPVRIEYVETPRQLDGNESVLVLQLAPVGRDFEIQSHVAYALALALSMTQAKKGPAGWTFFLGIDRPHVEGLSTWVGVQRRVPARVVDILQMVLGSGGRRVHREYATIARHQLHPFVAATDDGIEAPPKGPTSPDDSDLANFETRNVTRRPFVVDGGKADKAAQLANLFFSSGEGTDS